MRPATLDVLTHSRDALPRFFVAELHYAFHMQAEPLSPRGVSLSKAMRVLAMNERDIERENNRLEQMSAHAGPETLPTGKLLEQIRHDAKELFKMEVELAKAEAKQDLNSEIDLAKGVGVATVCALLGLNMLIVSAVFALAPEYAWLAALIVGIILLAIAGGAAYFGWKRAQKNPLNTTRTTLQEDLEWAKQQLIK